MSEHVLYFTVEPTTTIEGQRSSYRPRNKRLFWRAVEQLFMSADISDVDEEIEFLAAKHFVTPPDHESYGGIDFIAIKFMLGPTNTEQDLKEKLFLVGTQFTEVAVDSLMYGINNPIRIDLHPDEWVVVNFPGVTAYLVSEYLEREPEMLIGMELSQEAPAEHYSNYLSLLAMEAVDA